MALHDNPRLQVASPATAFPRFRHLPCQLCLSMALGPHGSEQIGPTTLEPRPACLQARTGASTSNLVIEIQR